MQAACMRCSAARQAFGGRHPAVLWHVDPTHRAISKLGVIESSADTTGERDTTLEARRGPISGSAPVVRFTTLQHDRWGRLQEL